KHGISACEACGMRARRLLPLCAATGLHHDHGLAGLPSSLQQVKIAFAIRQTFNVQTDRPGVGIANHVLEEVADIEIDLIANGDDLAEADSLIVGAVIDGKHQGPALRDEPDVATMDSLDIEDARRRQGHAVAKIDETEA